MKGVMEVDLEFSYTYKWPGLGLMEIGVQEVCTTSLTISSPKTSLSVGAVREFACNQNCLFDIIVSEVIGKS